MKNTVKINSVDLINADCLHFIQSLPDDSIDLIVTDPPYFKVKPNGWDNQWKGDEDYLKWLDHCLAQFWRVLKPAGSLYLFCGHRLASDIEIMMRERFNVLNHIIWAKPSGRWNGCNKESLRAYFPATERVLFAEHYQGPYRGKSDGYAAKERELKQHIMAPLISYFRDARAELGITAKQIAEATGKKNMVSHWFGASQWQLPNEADYRKLQALFSRICRRCGGVNGVGHCDGGKSGQNLYLDNLEATGLYQVPLSSAQPGDVLLCCFGSSVPNHAAIYCGDGELLHHIPEQLSKRERYTDKWQRRTHSLWRHRAWRASAFTGIYNDLAAASICV